MKETEPTIEKKEFGKDVIIRDIYYRHGDKTPEGQLAPSGFKQGQKAGKKLEKAKHYHSEIQRAEDFSRTIKESTEKPEEYSEKGRMRMELGGTMNLSDQWKKEWGGKVKNEGLDVAVQWYLDEYKETNPDDPETISSYEMACRIAKSVFDHSRMAKRLKKGSRENLANGSHTPMLDVFIATVLKEQIEKDPKNPEGKTLIEKMGGSFAAAEQFEVETKIDDKGNKAIKIKFRDKEYDLPEEKLEEMAARVDKEKLMEETAGQRKKKLEKEKQE